MKYVTMILTASLISLAASSAFAGASYTESLKAADAALGAQQADGALIELDIALTQAVTGGERALALSKKGYVLAFMKQDYGAARTAVDVALKTPDLAPVAKVTALQVLAECQRKTEKNFTAAIENLTAALALPDVDWAKPALTLSLADCYRESMQLELAMNAYRSLTEMANADAGLKAGAYLNIGFIYQYDRKDSAMARENYAKAVGLRPDLQAEVNRHQSTLP